MSGALKSVGSAIGGLGQQLFGGSKSRASQQSGIDPRFFEMFASNLERAKGVAEALGPRQFADFTPDFWAGAQTLRDTVSGPAMGTTNNAVAMAQQAGRFTPQDVTAGAFPSGDLDAYLNPYTSAVVDTALADLERQRQIQQQYMGHAATQAGAFGGSRHGVAEAETNRAFADIGARTAAGLRQQGFDSAANLMQQDMNRRLQAQLANQQAGLAGNQQALAAAGLLGSLGAQQQQMGLQGAAALMGLGGLLQGHEQARLDAIRNLPLEQQAIINEALGINPGGGSGMQSSGSSRSDSYKGILSWAFPNGK